MSDVDPRTDARMRELVEKLRTRNAQLTHALESRIVIEQAKGILAERYRMPVDSAFELLRRSARSNRVRLHDLAARVVEEDVTPPEISLTVANPVSGRF